MAAPKNPLNETKRTLKFQGPSDDGATVSFVEHHTFDQGKDGERVEGITMVVLSTAAWKKAGSPFDLPVTIG